MNRLLYMGDNLKVLRELKSGSVKMAYLDPPYNSGKVYRKKKGEFTDTFTKRRRSLDKAIRGKSPISADFIKLAADMHGESMAAYLQFMAIRVIEVHRILSGDGSLYYQCDDRVSHYIKAVLDCVFGAAQYRNDIVWRRAAAHNDAKRFGRILDNIFYLRQKRRGQVQCGRREDAEERRSEGAFLHIVGQEREICGSGHDDAQRRPLSRRQNIGGRSRRVIRRIRQTVARIQSKRPWQALDAAEDRVIRQMD